MTLAPVEEPQALEVDEPVVAAAPETPIAPAASTPEPEEALAAYEAELGITEAAAPQSPTTTPPANPETSPEVLAAAQRIADENEAKRQQVQQQNGLLADFRDRRSRINNHLMAVAQGRAALNIQGVIDEFNNQYAQAERVAKIIHDAGYTDEFYKEAEAHIPGLSKDKANHKGTSDRLKAVVEKAREGYSSKGDLEKAVKAARVEEYQKLSKNPAVLRAMLSKAEGSTGASGNAIPTGAFDPESSSLADVNKHLAALGL